VALSLQGILSLEVTIVPGRGVTG